MPDLRELQRRIDRNWKILDWLFTIMIGLAAVRIVLACIMLYLVLHK